MSFLGKMLESIPSAITGAIIAVLITYCYTVLKSIKRISKKEKEKIIDNWYINIGVFDAKEGFTITSNKMRIKLNWKKQYIVTTNDKNDNAYFGMAIVEATNLIINLKSKQKNYPDSTCHRFHISPQEKYKIYYGTFVSSDYRQKNCSGISILARENLGYAKIKDLIKRNYFYSSDFGAISTK